MLFLPGPAWLLLSKIARGLIHFLYIRGVSAITVANKFELRWQSTYLILIFKQVIEALARLPQDKIHRVLHDARWQSVPPRGLRYWLPILKWKETLVVI